VRRAVRLESLTYNPIQHPSGEQHMPENYWTDLAGGVISAVIYGLISIALVIFGFKVFDWITPKIDIQHELSEKHNVAVAIICAAVILGVSCIVAVAVK
jgi:putative membrane protein